MGRRHHRIQRFLREGSVANGAAIGSGRGPDFASGVRWKVIVQKEPPHSLKSSIQKKIAISKDDDDDHDDSSSSSSNNNKNKW